MGIVIDCGTEATENTNMTNTKNKVLQTGEAKTLSNGNFAKQGEIVLTRNDVKTILATMDALQSEIVIYKDGTHMRLAGQRNYQFAYIYAKED